MIQAHKKLYNPFPNIERDLRLTQTLSMLGYQEKLGA